MTTSNTNTSASPRLKTLYLTGHGTTLAKKQQRFIVKKDGESHEIPAIHVNQIMLLGNIQLTTQVMHYCLKNNIPIYFLSSTGSYIGTLDNHDTHPIELQRQQYRKAEDHNWCKKTARQFIKGKLHNSQLLLKRLARSQQNTPHHDQLQQSARDIASYSKQLKHATTLDQLRGIEGIAARTYFQTLHSILPNHWLFNGRNKQPPRDPINALLSYGYTLLFHNVYTFIKASGLNPHIGFLHPARRGHPALASDLMEEFRAVIVDAVVFNMIINNKLKFEEFQIPETPGKACRIHNDARRKFIRELENKFNSAITHPVNGNRIDYRRCIEHQVKHLAELIRIDSPDIFDNTSDNTYQPVLFR